MQLRQLQRHQSLLAQTLDLLVDAQLGQGQVDRASTTGALLGDLATATGSDRLMVLATAAKGRVAMASGDQSAIELLDAARQGLGPA